MPLILTGGCPLVTILTCAVVDAHAARDGERRGWGFDAFRWVGFLFGITLGAAAGSPGRDIGVVETAVRLFHQVENRVFQN